MKKTDLLCLKMCQLYSTSSVTSCYTLIKLPQAVLQIAEMGGRGGGGGRENLTLGVGEGYWPIDGDAPPKTEERLFRLEILKF